MAKETIIIDGVRYYADRPLSCRGCFFWKNRKGWRDDQDRVYIIFTIAEITESMNCGNKKAIQLQRSGSRFWKSSSALSPGRPSGRRCLRRCSVSCSLSSP